MFEPHEKAEVLIEALPFLKRYHDRIVVVKLSGSAIEDPAILEPLLLDLVWLEQVGVRPVLVHGGGTSITRAMEESGIEVKWHEGRRITDKAAMDIVFREVERLNAHLVDRLIDLGGAAIGMVPPRHRAVSGKIANADLGLVGQPVGIDRDRIHRYTSRGLIPVVPPLSTNFDGKILNTNADDIALAVAEGMLAEKLVFCSNVPGVCRDPSDPSTRISTLTPDEVRRLVDEGVIAGGMIPKVESCLGALEAGVGKIHIIDAAMAHGLLMEIFTRAGIGTQLCRPAMSA